MFLFVMSIIDGQENNTLFYEQRANNYYEQSQFNEALLDCERVIYQSSDFKLKTKALFLKAECYKQLGDSKNAISTLMSIRVNGLDSLSIFSLYYELALNNYLNENYDEAGAHVQNMIMIDSNRTNSGSPLLLKIMVLNELSLWDSVKTIISSSSSFSSDEKTYLISLYNERPKLFKGKKLDWYSRFIPGSGQVITGYPVEGSISFILCASALSFGIYEVYTGYYITGYFLGAGFLNGFYYGGLRRLARMIEHENQRRKISFNSKINLYLKNKGW